MSRSPRRWAALGLVALLLATACEDTSCGGCVAPPAEPFPNQPRVYEGVQIRISEYGFDFVEQNLPQIIDTLLADGLQFDIPSTTTSILGVDINLCQSGCPIVVEILNSYLVLVPNDTIQIDGSINVDSVISLDSILGHCEFPLALQDKPLSAQVQLLLDLPETGFMYFDVTGVNVTIEDNDYDIQCPVVYDWLLELLKSFITGILNSQIQGQLDSAIGDLIAAQTCLGCDFYTNGCPPGSSCNGDYCESGGSCLIKPLGMVGTIDLGGLLASVDPTNTATLDLLVATGQAQPASQRPFVRASGLEVRAIGGTWSDADNCIPPPGQGPPVGLADPMRFDNLIPGQGDTYMVGIAIADMYLDHFVHQLWRSGFFCLSIDSYGLDLITSGTLALILPSLGALAEGANLPVRLQMLPESSPFMEVGAGTFSPDGTVDEPILYVHLPDLRLDFWIKLHGRWTRFLSLSQDVRLDLALEFTPENTVLPIVGEDSIVVDNVHVLHYELLSESEQQLADMVPQLIGLALPQLLGSLEAIAIPDLQGFVLDIKALQGDVQVGSTYKFMSIYADLGFAPNPAPVETRVELIQSHGLALGLRPIGSEPQSLEFQYRLDGRVWSPFLRGDFIPLRGLMQPGNHQLEVRARALGEYRSLDPTPQVLPFWVRPDPIQTLAVDPDPGRLDRTQALSSAEQDEAAPRVGCASSASGQGLLGLLFGLVLLFCRRVRKSDS